MQFYTSNLVNVTRYICDISEDAVKAGFEQEQVFSQKKRLGLTLGFRSSHSHKRGARCEFLLCSERIVRR